MELKQREDYHFQLDEDWLKYLEENGYVVIKGVANNDEVNHAIDLYWKHFESHSKAKRDDPTTWVEWGVDIRGIVVDGGTIQSEAAWYVRALPKIKSVFSKIWSTDSLLVSMDSVILWKPWWGSSKSRIPRTEGFHVDQNPFLKPGKECFQGMVPLYDVTMETGGLQVVPKSHLPEAKSYWQNSGDNGDFVMLKPSDPMRKQGKLVLASAGDIIIWDSRTVHGGWVGTGTNTEPTHLTRLSQTVCMTPKSKASDKVLTERVEGFEQGLGFSHWPHQVHVTCHPRQGYKPITLTAEQKDLLS